MPRGAPASRRPERLGVASGTCYGVRAPGKAAKTPRAHDLHGGLGLNFTASLVEHGRFGHTGEDALRRIGQTKTVPVEQDVVGQHSA